MNAIRFRFPALALALLLILAAPVSAAEAQGASVYCLAQEDFTDNSEGIFVLSVPEQSVGTICSGDRVIRPGDVLTAESLSDLTLNTRCKTDAVAELTYLPLFEDSIGERTTLSVTIRSGKAGVPTAKDLELETYKNIANDGKLKAADEGGGELTFSIETEPKLGTVELQPDGTFVYTPEKNKVGEDSFTYTVSDKDGNTSAPAEVKINILKPKAEQTYEDMEGADGAFEAMWLQEQGIFSGSMIGEHLCFCPDQTVSRGEFLTLAMRMMELEPVEEIATGFVDEAEAAAWMRPYLASAMRSGVIRGVSTEDGLKFLPNRPVTCAEAAVMLQNLMRLPVTDATEVIADQTPTDVPAWAADAVAAMCRYDLPGFSAAATEPMTRMETANLLYCASKLK